MRLHALCLSAEKHFAPRGSFASVSSALANPLRVHFGLRARRTSTATVQGSTLGGTGGEALLQLRRRVSEAIRRQQAPQEGLASSEHLRWSVRHGPSCNVFASGPSGALSGGCLRLLLPGGAVLPAVSFRTGYLVCLAFLRSDRSLGLDFSTIFSSLSLSALSFVSTVLLWRWQGNALQGAWGTKKDAKRTIQAAAGKAPQPEGESRFSGAPSARSTGVMEFQGQANSTVVLASQTPLAVYVYACDRSRFAKPKGRGVLFPSLFLFFCNKSRSSAVSVQRNQSSSSLRTR